MGVEINNNLREIFKRDLDIEDDDSDSGSNRHERQNVVTKEDLEDWLLEKIPVFRVLSPFDHYVLTEGDIIY